MGVLYHQMVICVTHDYDCNDLSKLDNIVDSHPKLFVKSQVLTNSVINYVMFWDGSKEGWDESDKGDALREEFINLSKQLELADIYEINDHESGTPELAHTNTYNLRHSTGSAKNGTDVWSAECVHDKWKSCWVKDHYQKCKELKEKADNWDEYAAQEAGRFTVDVMPLRGFDTSAREKE